MDYSKLTKSELIVLLERSAHLAEAVENKDELITELSKKVERLESQLIDQNHLADAVEAKDKEIYDLKQELLQKTTEQEEKHKKVLDDLSYKFTQEGEKVADGYEKKMNQLIGERDAQKKLWEQYADGLYKTLDAYHVAHVALLKNIQGAVESASELNAYLENRIPRP